MEYNCGFINDKKAFRYRAAAIIVEEGCVLFARNDEDDYFYSVGGAVHMGETSEEAVKREVFEETGLNYKETMHWLPIDELDKCKAYPTFMKEYLKSEHSGIEHIISDERY